jgi:phosphate transport system substrate-binding protein
MRMKLAAIVAIAASLTLLCGGESNWAWAQASTAIRVGGSNSLVQALQNWGDDFKARNPSVNVIATGGGTASGLEKLLNKQADMVFASEQLTDAQKKSAAGRGVNLVEQFCQMGGSCIVVNAANPTDSLTLDQLRKLFSGEITSWKDLGGPDERVRVVVRKKDESGTTRVFEEEFLPGKSIVQDAYQAGKFGDLIDTVSQNKGCIGLIGCLALTTQKHSLKIVGLKASAEAPAVKPSSTAFKDKSYPLSRPLYFYWDGATPIAKTVKEFADFCSTKIWEGR